MGLINKIRDFFSGSKDVQIIQPQRNERYEKEKLASNIVNLVDKIKKINSFDSSIWNLSNVSTFDLQQKSLNELQKISFNLENSFANLQIKNQRRNSNSEALEASKWTGQRSPNMNNFDFDRFQRSDDCR